MGRRPAGDAAQGRGPDPSFWEGLEAAEAAQLLDHLSLCTLKEDCFVQRVSILQKGVDME